MGDTPCIIVAAHEPAVTHATSSMATSNATPTKRRLWSTRHGATFVRFAGVATTIAGIDIAVLYALHRALGANVYLARVLSYTAAITTGYFLNRRFTFYHHRRTRSVPGELVRFYAVFACGGVINYAVFSAVVAAGALAGAGETTRFWLPLLGVWLGGLAGMAFNYGLSNKLVFANR